MKKGSLTASGVVRFTTTSCDPPGTFDRNGVSTEIGETLPSENEVHSTLIQPDKYVRNQSLFGSQPDVELTCLDVAS